MVFNLNIQEGCQEMSSVCIRLMFCSIWAGIVVIVALATIYKIYQMRNCFCYEMSPLISSAIQASLQLFQFLFYSNNQLVMLTNYIQIITFAFLGQSFANLYYRITILDPNQFKRTYKRILSIQACFYISMFILILVFTYKVELYDCTNNFYVVMFLILLQIVFTCLLTDFYGYKLIQEINKLSQISQSVNQVKQPMKRSSTFEKLLTNGKLSKVSNSDAFFDKRVNSSEAEIFLERRKQIWFVLVALTITTTLYAIALPSLYVKLQTYICEQEYRSLNGSINIFDNLFLTLLSLLQMTPCIYLSIAFYYLPTVERLQSSTYQDQDFNLSDDGLRRESIHVNLQEDLFVASSRKLQDN